MSGAQTMDGKANGDSGVAPIVELRHEAGLTAGRSLQLRPGRFSFGPQRADDGGLVSGTPEVVSFDLRIDGAGEAVLTAGAEPVAVEGVLVDRPARLQDGDVVQLTTDHFVLRSIASETDQRAPKTIEPRAVAAPELPTMWTWLAIFGLTTLAGCIAALSRSSWIGLALIGLGGLVATLAIRAHRRRQAVEQHATAILNARSLFFSEIIDARKAAAEALRADANTPAVIAAAARGDGAIASDLNVTIASGDRAWTPSVEVHRRTGWDHKPIIDELSFLPAIPFTVDLDSGPVAILGPRAATIAVARHIATTVLVVGGADTGVEVATDVPADWRWLGNRRDTTVRILDRQSGGTGDDSAEPVGPRTVVLQDSSEDLVRAHPGVRFHHVMTIDDDGHASISSDSDGNGTGFVPHGITDRHARDLRQLISEPDDVIDLRDANDRTLAVFSQPRVGTFAPSSDDTMPPATTADRSDLLSEAALDTTRLLVTGIDRSKNKNLLATAALRQAANHADHTLYVLDRGDRALIRLAQLDTCARYVPLDQIDEVGALFDELDALTADDTHPRCLLLAPDLWDTVDFYRSSDNRLLADQIDRVVSKMAEVPIAASSSEVHSAPRQSFLVWVETTDDDVAEVRGHDNSGRIDLVTLPGVDLTGSIAKLALIAKRETQR